MANIAFIDDNLLLCDCYVKRNYDELEKRILENKDDLTESIIYNGAVFGFNITLNNPLTEIYKMNCYVVKFVFSYVSQLHDNNQEEILCQLLKKLNEYMKSCKGYYNLRIPTHIVDLVKAVNATFSNIIFCGGTVEELIYGKYVEDNNKNNLVIEFADNLYIEKYKEDLMKMTLDSFKSYQGQYHISNVTQSKAGLIYENWIRESMKSLSDEKIVVAQYNDKPIGFVTIKEQDNAVEGVLSAVDSENRKLGAYKSMIAYLINYANRADKSFVTSTQFDNFIVQGVWNSLGLRPFYSIYNMHIDNR